MQALISQEQSILATTEFPNNRRACWIDFCFRGVQISHPFCPSSLLLATACTMKHPHVIVTFHTGQGEPGEDSLLLLDILHWLVLFTYVKCGTKYLLNLPRKRPNSEHSWKQFIVSLYTVTQVLCHYGRSHKADGESALPFHLSQWAFMDKKHYSYILLAQNWLFKFNFK